MNRGDPGTPGFERRQGVEPCGNEKCPGNASTSPGRHQEASPDASSTLQALATAAHVQREAVKNKAYRQFPIGQDGGAYLRQNRGRLLPTT